MGALEVNFLPSTFLFALPRSVSGAGTILDLGATMFDYNQARGAAEADAIALAMDAVALRGDFEVAIKEVIPEGVGLRPSAAQRR